MKFVSELKKVWSRLLYNNHWHHWLYYYERLSPSPQSVPRIYITLPIVYIIYFMVRGASYLIFPQMHADHPALSLILCSRVLFQTVRASVEMCIQFWAILALGCSALEMCVPPSNLQFLQLLFANHDQLSLDSLSASKFIKLRSRALTFLSFQLNSLPVLVFISFLIGGYFGGIYDVSIVLSVLGAAFLGIFTHFADYAAYAMPCLAMIVIDYLKRKQSCLVARLDRLMTTTKKIASLNRLKSVNREYVEMGTTVDKYDGQFWRYFLTHFVLMYGLVVTYIVYILFFTTLPVHFYVALSSIALGHLICFVFSLQSVAAVYSNNRLIQAKLHQLHHRFVLQPKHISMSDRVLRESLMLERQTSHVSAFRFLNRLPITALTVLSIFHNVSILFILIFF